MEVKKIIVDQVYLDKFIRITHKYESEVDMPYLAGKYSNLVPDTKDATLKDFDRKFINESSLFNEVIKIKTDELYYLLLQKDYKINSLLFSPEDVAVDLYVHKDGRLIYSFYNCSDKDKIRIQGSVCKDYDKIAEKIKTNLEDVYFRNYFIKLAQEDYTRGITMPEFYPANMDVNQVAAYLGKSRKTIQKWTSEKKIPVAKVGNTVIYRKVDIDDFLEKKTIKAKN